MPCCAAIGCSTKKNDKTVVPPISLHQFPLDEEEKKKWVLAVNRKEWWPSKRSCLCSKHFTEDCFDRSEFYSKLIKGAVPTIFDFNQEQLKQKVTQNETREKLSESSEEDCLQSVQDYDPVQLQAAVQYSGSSAEDSPAPELSKIKNTRQFKRRKYDDSTAETTTKNFPTKSKPYEDRYDLFGKSVAIKMRDVSSNAQRLLAEKIINDCLFMAEMNKLTNKHLFQDIL